MNGDRALIPFRGPKFLDTSLPFPCLVYSALDFNSGAVGKEAESL
jgi:hypothetical protein